MGTTSLTFQVSGVSELLGQIEKIQAKMAGLDMSMSKAQLSTEMTRIERLMKDASTFANTLYSSLNKIETANVGKAADGLKAVGKESVDASGKVVESTNKMSRAINKTTDSVAKAAQTHASYRKSILSTDRLMNNFAGSITSVVAGYASIQTVISTVNAAFQEQQRILNEASTSMQNYAKVSGQLGQKAGTIEELGEYRKVVDKLATSGALPNREEATQVAYAMLSANMPISAVEGMIPALQAGLFSPSDLAGLIKASGPIMTFDKNTSFQQLMSMAVTSSKANVSDTAKIIQAVSDSNMMNEQIGTTTDESFAIADVIAQSTYNADEARTWQKNFTKDVWKRVMGKVAESRMKAIDPNATQMEGYVSGYDSKGKPIADPNFRMTFSEFGEWAKEYYGADPNMLKKDFADIRGGQGALAVINALMDGRFDQALANVRAARQNDVIGQKAAMTLAGSPERRLAVQTAAAQSRSNIANEADAAINSYMTIAEQNYQSSAEGSGGKFFAGWANWLNARTMWTQEGKARQLWNSKNLTPEQRRDVIYNFAKANPNFDAGGGGRLREKMDSGAGRQNDGFYTAVYQAQKQIEAGATQYTPVSGAKAYDDAAIVEMAKSAEKAANALNKAADAADKAATKLQNQVVPTPGQSGALTPATI